MSKFNQDTLLFSYVSKDMDSINEHIKRGIKSQMMTTKSFLRDIELANYSDDYYKLLIKLVPCDIFEKTIVTKTLKLSKIFITEIVPTHKHLLLACQTKQDDLIKILLNHRLTIDQECFNERFLYNRSHEDAEHIADMIELFNTHGHIITINDVTNLVRLRYYVRDIERYNLTFNDEFHQACEDTCYWPYSPKHVPFKINNIVQVVCKMHGDSLISTQILEYVKLPSLIEFMNHGLTYRHGSNITIGTLRVLCDYIPITDDDICAAKNNPIVYVTLMNIKNEKNTS